MSQNDVAQQVTVRLPPGLLQDARRIAKRRHISLNRLVRESLERVAQEEREIALRASYDLLGRDPHEADVGPFATAQAKVVLRG